MMNYGSRWHPNGGLDMHLIITVGGPARHRRMHVDGVLIIAYQAFNMKVM